VITLFHSPKVTSSTRVYTLLKQANAHAASTATEDQASSHHTQSKQERTDFELDVTEEAPTQDQLKNILDYVGAGKAGDLVKGAKDASDAIKKLNESGDNFLRPVVSAAQTSLVGRQSADYGIIGCRLGKGKSW